MEAGRMTTEPPRVTFRVPTSVTTPACRSSTAITVGAHSSAETCSQPRPGGITVPVAKIPSPPTVIMTRSPGRASPSGFRGRKTALGRGTPGGASMRPVSRAPRSIGTGSSWRTAPDATVAGGRRRATRSGAIRRKVQRPGGSSARKPGQGSSVVGSCRETVSVVLSRSSTFAPSGRNAAGQRLASCTGVEEPGVSAGTGRTSSAPQGTASMRWSSPGCALVRRFSIQSPAFLGESRTSQGPSGASRKTMAPNSSVVA